MDETVVEKISRFRHNDNHTTNYVIVIVYETS
jgi:hypothetical protein